MLGFLTIVLESTKSSFIRSNVHSSLFLEFSDAVTHKNIVDVLSTEVKILNSCLNTKDMISDSQHCQIQSASTKVIDEYFYLRLGLPFNTVSYDRSYRLIHHMLHCQASKCHSFSCSLLLLEVEICRNCYYSILDNCLRSTVGFSHTFHLFDYHGCD